MCIRDSNTFICAGESTREEIIANTEYGLYAKRMGGGSVNPATGEFNFAVAEGYMVRGGKIAEPVRGATLIGRGSEILQKIDMVASNLATGQGMCGSVSGSIPADVGQPTIRVTAVSYTHLRIRSRTSSSCPGAPLAWVRRAKSMSIPPQIHDRGRQ